MENIVSKTQLTDIVYNKWTYIFTVTSRVGLWTLVLKHGVLAVAALVFGCRPFFVFFKPEVAREGGAKYKDAE